MQRVTTTDAGSRYLATLPFARDVSEDDRAGIRKALSAASFNRRRRYDDTPIDTQDVEVTSDEARVRFGLPADADHTPADVLGRLSAAIGGWHSREGPLSEPTRDGGEQTLASLDAASLGVDRAPAGDADEMHAYTIAFPNRSLTGEEVELVDYVSDAETIVTSSFVALVDAVSLVKSSPARRALRGLQERLTGHIPADHDLRAREFFPTREVGTLASVDDVARQALRERGQRKSPHTTTDAEEVTA